MDLGASNKNYRVADSVMLKQSSVGEGSTIDKDSIVMNTVIGKHCDIERRNLIRKAVIGNMTYTGADTSIMWAEVGKYCCISRLVDIGGNEHNYKAASMMPDYRLTNKLKGTIRKHQDEEIIKVGNDVWIGQGVAIARKPGLTIGDGAVIGAGAVVTKSVPPYAIAAGVPAKVIGYRFPEDMIKKLMEIRWWDWPEEKILGNWDLLKSDLTEESLDQLIKNSK